MKHFHQFSATSSNFDDTVLLNDETDEYKCIVCKEMFHSVLDLNEHYRKHLDDQTIRTVEISDDELFHCKHCDDEFCNENDLLAHNNVLHQVPSNEKKVLEDVEM